MHRDGMKPACLPAGCGNIVAAQRQTRTRPRFGPAAETISVAYAGRFTDVTEVACCRLARKSEIQDLLEIVAEADRIETE